MYGPPAVELFELLLVEGVVVVAGEVEDAAAEVCAYFSISAYPGGSPPPAAAKAAASWALYTAVGQVMSLQ